MALLSQLNHVCMLAILLRVKTSRNVGAYFGNLRPAAMMAIATDSSAATLPVTMACAETNKLRRKTIDLVFPLGATVNMDGSCIYYVQAVLFLSAMAGYQMTFAQQVQAAVVGALITCGAAPIPGGIPTPPSPLFLGHFSPVLRLFPAVPLRCPASWRRDGENGRKMAETVRNLGEKRARNSGG